MLQIHIGGKPQKLGIKIGNNLNIFTDITQQHVCIQNEKDQQNDAADNKITCYKAISSTRLFL